ncbi:N-acetylmuramate alpha-1-phosphate uridylyltransferase MurU [Aquabacterium sp. CECT 9606]|uniref:N-acetylmuramate alpha-1-phosphate uridylyltransferase MurU n=1 Tax=Aquabacterium sp. CECT 9606 TaxID=2845822 RepID=UPI001EF9BD2F|nr:nucleotidyltransferase family protein [Aquabacterium sp. CECT 9606]CAH0348541.1 N-acetylmuramate alpha-1-phosphate uridylyltransferase [Aquabacterium sp. CECT 9606]
MTLPALILAAGRGERMRPLTDHTPKPLIKVRGKPLIEWHLEALARDGVREVVINTAWLEEQFPAALGDGSRWGLQLRYSMEGRDHGGALETAGGMAKALPLLGDVFWVLAGDVFAPDFTFNDQTAQRFAHGKDWAHLWMVGNPPHNPSGDFALSPEGRVLRKDQAPPATPCWTYSTIGLYRAAMVDGVMVGSRAALRPCLERAIDQGSLSAEIHDGQWVDVGTPARLAELNMA